MIKIIVILLLFFNIILSIQRPDCNKWYTLYGCENKMILMKNIRRSDNSNYISTQILTHNPEKKITCLIDFGMPNEIKYNLIQSIENATSSNIPLNESLLFMGQYVDDFIEPYVPLYIDLTTYMALNLHKGVTNSVLEHGKKLFFSTKGKPYSIQFKTALTKDIVSFNWYTSLFTDYYTGLLNVGKHSGIWNVYNYISIENTRIILSDNNIFDENYLFNENRIDLQCSSMTDVLNYYSEFGYYDMNPIEMMLSSRCYGLSSVYLKESHKENSYKNIETFNIILDPNSNTNKLPSKLFFLLYDTNSGTSTLNSPKKTIKNDNNKNFFKLNFYNSSNAPLSFTSSGIFSFNHNTENNNDIILGVDMFKYFSKIVYNKQYDSYSLWIDDITTDSDYAPIVIDMLFIIETLLLLRWYLTSHTALSKFIFFYIYTKNNNFYYNNSKSFAEIIIIGISLIIIGISFSELITIPNIPIYLIVSFAGQCLLLFIFIGLTIYYLVLSKDKIAVIIKSLYKKKKETTESSDEEYEVVKRSMVTKWEKNATFNSKQDSKKPMSTKKMQNIIDVAVLKLYSLSTAVVIKQDILITISRNLTHLILIILTMATGYIFYLDTLLIKVIATIISSILVYFIAYYYFLLIHTFVVFRSNYDKKIWITYIVFLGILLLVLLPYISITFVFNLLDSMNANHSTLLVSLTSIYLILLIMVIPASGLLRDIVEWKGILYDNKELDVNTN